MYCLVREAGGFGDTVCIGAAARAIKREHPQEEVVCFVPFEFVNTAEHLAHIDEVVSLGTLSEIRLSRRRRDAQLDPERYPYLKSVCAYPGAQVVSLFCPGYLYESSCPGVLEYNRSQVFAMAVGARQVLDARPEWVVGEAELAVARGIVGSGSRTIAVQARATCPARSLGNLAGPLVAELTSLGDVFVFDCVKPRFELPSNCVPVIGQPLPVVAACLSLCKVAVTADTLFVHLAAAVGTPAVGVFGPTDGRNIMSSYPRHAPLDGTSGRCALPCNYNMAKGWSPECRVTGCDRMKSHSPAGVLERVNSLLANDLELTRDFSCNSRGTPL